MIVCKFGGTSVGTADAIGRLVEIVRGRQAERPLVVVSALSGMTDALLRIVGLLAEGDGAPVESQVGELVARHERTAAELGLPADAVGPIVAEAMLFRQWLGERVGRTLGPADRDELVRRGELWSSWLVAAALQARGVPAEWVDVTRAIRTNDEFTRAIPDLAAIGRLAPAVFTPLLDAGRVPVTQGFLGVTADGRATTLGRGGSDYTAALLGSALGAARVEIWTDVDGIMTADPRIVPGARVLPVASHVEAAELATFGAKVLHPATQAPLVEAKIPCIVLNSFAPDRPGTSVLSGVRPEPVGESPVRAISWKKGVTVVNVRAARMLGAVGFMRQLFEIVERYRASVDVVATSEINVSLTLDDPSHVGPIAAELARLGEVTIHEHRAIVAVVGVGLRGTKGLSGRIFNAIRGINVEMISQGASEINVTLVVKEEDGPTAVRLLHDEFFGREAA